MNVTNCLEVVIILSLTGHKTEQRDTSTSSYNRHRLTLTEVQQFLWGEGHVVHHQVERLKVADKQRRLLIHRQRLQDLQRQRSQHVNSNIPRRNRDASHATKAGSRQTKPVLRCHCAGSRADSGPTFTQHKGVTDPSRPRGPSLRPPPGPDVHLPRNRKP